LSVLLLAAPVVVMGAGDELWLDVPYVHQQKEGCGSAAIAMVLQYWGQKGASIPEARTDESKIQQQLYSKKVGGIQASEMEKYLPESGFKTLVFRAEWNDLQNHLEKGRPLIAAIQPKSKSPLHFVVVVGMDEKKGAVLLNDPQRGRLFRVEQNEFVKEWPR